MTKVTSDLLNDTINLVQLARETALARGDKSQAQRLAPVADNLLNLVTDARKQVESGRSSPSSAIMGQSDFQTLLSAVKSSPAVAPNIPPSMERNQVVLAMASAGMNDIDIARHMGITREEVRLIMTVNRSRLKAGGIIDD